MNNRQHNSMTFLLTQQLFFVGFFSIFPLSFVNPFRWKRKFPTINLLESQHSSSVLFLHTWEVLPVKNHPLNFKISRYLSLLTPHSVLRLLSAGRDEKIYIYLPTLCLSCQTFVHTPVRNYSTLELHRLKWFLAKEPFRLCVRVNKNKYI